MKEKLNYHSINQGMLYDKTLVNRIFIPEYCKVHTGKPFSKSFVTATIRDKNNKSRLTEWSVVLKETRPNIYEVVIPYRLSAAYDHKYYNIICEVRGDFFTVNLNSKNISTGEDNYKLIVFTGRRCGIGVTHEDTVHRLDFSNPNNVIKTEQFDYSPESVSKGVASYKSILDKGVTQYTKPAGKFKYHCGKINSDDNHLLLQLINSKFVKRNRR